MFKKFAMIVVIVMLIVAAAMAIAAPAFASASCQYNPQHGWHIVGGGEDNDHWFETETECLIALQVPTALATLQSTPVVTETASPEPTEPPVVTETPNPTDEPTTEPTEPPVVTETPYPTELPTEVVPTSTPDPATALPPAARKGMSCQRAWTKITETVYEREVGFRFFENPNHEYCEAWLVKTHGIVWDIYKVMYPLE